MKISEIISIVHKHGHVPKGMYDSIQKKVFKFPCSSSVSENILMDPIVFIKNPSYILEYVMKIKLILSVILGTLGTHSWLKTGQIGAKQKLNIFQNPVRLEIFIDQGDLVFYLDFVSLKQGYIEKRK